MSDPRISGPQCGTIRKAGINFKSKEIWRDRGGTIRESGTIRENTVFGLLIVNIYVSFSFLKKKWQGFEI